MATDTRWILSALGAAVAPPRSACHFYPIYSSPGLIACFLSEEIFPVRVLYLSFISPVFRLLSVEELRDAFIPKASLLHTSANLSGSGSSKLLQAHKSNPAGLLWCHYGSLKSLCFQLPIILLPLISSQTLLFGSGWWRGRERERNSQRPTPFGPRFTESVSVVAHPWHLHWVILSNLCLHFLFLIRDRQLPSMWGSRVQLCWGNPVNVWMGRFQLWLHCLFKVCIERGCIWVIFKHFSWYHGTWRHVSYFIVLDVDWVGIAIWRWNDLPKIRQVKKRRPKTQVFLTPRWGLFPSHPLAPLKMAVVQWFSLGCLLKDRMLLCYCTQFNREESLPCWKM